MGLMMEGKRECRCGAIIDADVYAMAAHITSELHESRLAALGLLTHTHSVRWVDDEGHPVDVDTPGATLYVRDGCPACDEARR